jgi:hypothetical protein
MYSVIREITAGLSAAFVFLILGTPLFFKDIFDGSETSSLWWMALGLSLGTYFGIRLLFPSVDKKVKVALPDGISQEVFKKYISQCSLSLSLVREDAATVKNLSFQSTLLHLCDLGDDLVVNFTKDPGSIRIAQNLPDRLLRLHEMLSSYLDLSKQQNQSPQTMRALQATEKAVTKAVGKFEQLHRRLLENDAIDLSTNAKTLDNLLDFD